MNFKINFKKYREYCKHNFITIPAWMNLAIFECVVDMMEVGEKLRACKYLCDKSTEFNTRNEYGLKWAKTQVIDVIDSYRVIEDVQQTITSDEIRAVLTPFTMLGHQLIQNTNISDEQIVYAYNGVQVKMQDFRNLMSALGRLNSSIILSKS